ncbi:MAG: hypothetical protein J7L80_03025 [Thermoplasmata archaeon]|nr:hypothetical protein [Thermoplasmata archaeon]
MNYELMEKIADCLAFATIFLLPIIPCIAIWFFLSPITFWQKLATFILDGVAYLAILGFEILIIDNW